VVTGTHLPRVETV
jgi:hypothetical protein